MTCTHELGEMETACAFDGLCPLCLSAELDRIQREEVGILKAQLEECRYNNGINWPAEIDRRNRMEVAFAKQLERSIRRNSKVIAVLKELVGLIDNTGLLIADDRAQAAYEKAKDVILGNDE